MPRVGDVVLSLTSSPRGVPRWTIGTDCGTGRLPGTRAILWDGGQVNDDMRAGDFLVVAPPAPYLPRDPEEQEAATPTSNPTCDACFLNLFCTRGENHIGDHVAGDVSGSGRVAGRWPAWATNSRVVGGVILDPSGKILTGYFGRGLQHVIARGRYPVRPLLDCPTCKVSLATGLGGFYCPQCHWVRP